MKTSRPYLVPVVCALALLFSLVVPGLQSQAEAQTRTRHTPAKKKKAGKKPAVKSRAKTHGGRTRSSAHRARKTRGRRGRTKAVRNVAPPRPRFTLAGTGLQPTNPLLSDSTMTELRALAQAFLGAPSPMREADLRRFAARHPRELAGALAYLALGYSAYLAKHYDDAITFLKTGRGIQSDLADYFDYFLADSLANQSRTTEALELLTGFEDRYPQSSLVGRAVLSRAQAWINTGRASQAAELLRSRLGALRRPDADIMLARAYAAMGDFPKAVEAYRQVYYLYPTSSEADDAEKEMSRVMGQANVAPAALELRRERADRLYDARQYRPAEAAYGEVAAMTSGAEHDRAEVRRAACAYHLNSSERAYALLQSIHPADPSADAERLYWISQCQRRMNRDSDFIATVKQVGERDGKSPWYEAALFSAGNYFLLERDFEQSANYYRQIYETFPSGQYATIAHWRVGWKYYRAADYGQARKQFEEHIRLFPQSPQISAALYWLGRLAERAGEKAVAHAYYNKVVDTFPQYFYATQAREKLAGAPVLPAETLPANVTALLNSVRPARAPLSAGPPPPDLPSHRHKIEALEAAGLLDLAIIEVRRFTDDPGHNRFLTLELARLEYDRGRFQSAIEYIRRVVPNYFAYSFDDLDRDVWELLFPLPWWSSVQANAMKYGLDPYLVAALIRQESAFNPWAVSHANAYGLMQLLPVTARTTSRHLGRRAPSRTGLLDPVTNIQLGTYYLRQVIDRYNGRLEPALASYNAGPDRVDAWLAQNQFSDLAEFVESIPFTETREYVQALIRNAAVYRHLYGEKGSRPPSAQPPAAPPASEETGNGTAETIGNTAQTSSSERP